MSLTAIPLQFEKYLQNQVSVGNGPDMNEMIFAYIPGLDLSQPIDRSQGLPDVSLWVHQQDIDQVGKLGDNALVYSVVIPGSVDAFTFNAIYLRDKNVPNSCGMVVHKADETKENGMASTKSLMQQYTGAAQIAGIDVNAATWQIDYQARLLGIEDDMRLANVDTYGHTAFVDGFEVVQQADPTKYAISAGVAYVGGLRAVLDDEVIQTINTKPNGLYLDVVRMGTALSQWQNVVTIRLSPVELSDYVDGNNQQHFVAKIAELDAQGSVSDERAPLPLSDYLRKDELASQEDARQGKPDKVPDCAGVHAAFNQFGLGLEQAPLLGNFNESEVVNGQTFRTDGSTSGTNPAPGTNGFVRYERWGANDFVQYFWPATLTDAQLWMRRWKSGVFQNWVPFITSKNEQQIGYGQTYQDETTNRQANMAYKNTYGKPIMVSTNIQSGGKFEVSADGLTWLEINTWSSVSGAPTTPIIPVNWWYRATSFYGKWMELK
ncbi:phage tail protein [Vibrio fluvialis]|nr:phage tail protein [Vibrio fluvialis]